MNIFKKVFFIFIFSIFLYADEDTNIHIILNFPVTQLLGYEKAIEPEFQLSEHTSFDLTLSYIDWGSNSGAQGYRLGAGYKYYIEPMFSPTNNYILFHFQTVHMQFNPNNFADYNTNDFQNNINLFTTLLGYQFKYDYFIYNFGVGFAVGYYESTFETSNFLITPIGQMQIGIIF